MVSRKTKKIKMEVNFPRERPCVAASASLYYSGLPQSTLKSPLVSDDQSKEIFEVKNPKMGAHNSQFLGFSEKDNCYFPLYSPRACFPKGRHRFGPG